MDDHILEPEPAQIGACSRCRTRKVKCDGSIPQCTACLKHTTACDITEHVFYSYETVQRLRASVRGLKHQLRQSANTAVPTSLGSHHPPINQRVETFSTDRSASLHGDNSLPLRDQSSQRPTRFDDNISTIETLAEEVGSLALGQQSSQQYIGSAAGSSFCRIFFHQLNLVTKDNISQPGSNFWLHNPLATRASLPPKPIGLMLLSTYIVRVHMWRPIFNLKELRNWFQQAYSNPKTLNAFKKFSVFMVLALSSYDAEQTEATRTLMDIHSSAEYFATGMTFYDEISSVNDLQSLQSALLLGLWLTKASRSAKNTYLWQISRFVMSLAIELGCHRHNPRWEISASEREVRNRIWWSTYDLERTIAVSSGRVLSIRNQAIDAQFPKITDDDLLTDSEQKMSPTFAIKGFSPAIHMFRLRNISGDILESIYIARPRAGHHPSIQDTLIVADNIRERLTRWHSVLDECTAPESRESLEMRVELCLAIILLHRPSPSFPNPPESAIEACIDACQTAIGVWEVLLSRKELVIAWKTFHDVFVTGLVWLYCAYNLSTIDQSSVEKVGTTCIDLLEYIDRKNRTYGSYIKILGKIKGMTITRLQSQQPTSIQRASSDSDFDALGLDWMDGAFNDFTGSGDNFPLDFTMNEDMFQIPDNL